LTGWDIPALMKHLLLCFEKKPAMGIRRGLFLLCSQSGTEFMSRRSAANYSVPD
jgi:hypothetical protein